jgi:hypothetical protein
MRGVYMARVFICAYVYAFIYIYIYIYGCIYIYIHKHAPNVIRSLNAARPKFSHPASAMFRFSPFTRRSGYNGSAGVTMLAAAIASFCPVAPPSPRRCHFFHLAFYGHLRRRRLDRPTRSSNERRRSFPSPPSKSSKIQDVGCRAKRPS